MVTITSATIQSQLPYFCRSIIRTGVTDPNTTRRNESPAGSWVFKDNPQMEFTADDYPYVIVSFPQLEDESVDLLGSRWIFGDLLLQCNVYHNNQKVRDEVCDSIRALFRTPSSADADGDTITSNNLKVKSITSGVNDEVTVYPDMLRIGEMTIIMRYKGA